MRALKRWSLPGLAFMPFVLLALLVLGYPPAAARTDPCEERCRNAAKCSSQGPLPGHNYKACWPDSSWPEKLCFGTWGPEEECELPWCVEDCDPN
jgi:hypothetical protein